MPVKVTKPRIQFFDLVKMLLDSESWEFVKTFGTIEEIVHKEGFRYYADGSCICLRNETLGMEQFAGVFEFMLILPLASRNTRKVKARPTDKDRFARICAEGFK